MAGKRDAVRAMGAVAAVAVLTLTAAGCSDDTSPSDAASKAASAAASATAKIGDTVASATAEAGKKLDEFKGGVNAKDDVKLGDVTKDGGRATVPVTVTNSESATRSYAVQVDFRDSGGNLLDTIALTVSNVEAGKSKEATARSNRSLDGDVTADVARALRH
ncbi:hypothetical protein [Streptomyces sp. VRA16 Mangrove soil]|uniref:hypothetical protein n=1 Tax=Streptomyces sp. VRA16 Mangrove soil TaxID=2817434 RepID=UPI001A9DA7A1|nr:hypothetical protein [Streptomyces sp. VRA16 Mangrove soil]MBO1333281.1 hypothetical protein [Streptomyces sp. VRA16 Mangrove soil]